MSGMHLVRGMSSINTKKRRNKRQPGHAESQAKHDKWLMARGVHPSQLKKKDKSSGASIPDYKTTRTSVPTSDRITPIQGKRKANIYSGEYITDSQQCTSPTLFQWAEVTVRKNTRK